MDYVVVFDVRDDAVNVVGIFHQGLFCVYGGNKIPLDICLKKT